MKKTILLFVVIALNISAQNTGKIAIFDRDLIYKETYKYIHLLIIDKKTKEKILDLENQINNKQSEISSTKNQENLTKISKEISFLKYKKNTINDHIKEYKNVNAKHKVISDFIKENYKVEFTALVNKKHAINSSIYIIINTEPTDITKRIIDDIQKIAYAK